MVKEKIETAGVLTSMIEINETINENNQEKIHKTKVQLDGDKELKEFEVENKDIFYNYKKVFESSPTEIIVKIITEKREYYDGTIKYANILY